jgi:hypothetical protein
MFISIETLELFQYVKMCISGFQMPLGTFVLKYFEDLSHQRPKGPPPRPSVERIGSRKFFEVPNHPPPSGYYVALSLAV